MRKLGLVEHFALRSLVIVVLMVGALGFAVSSTVQDIFVSQAARTAQVNANALIIHHTEGGLDAPLEGKAKTELDLVVEDLQVAEVLAVKLWNRDGVLVYSSDAEDVTGVTYDDDDIYTALAGEVASKIETEGDEENINQVEKHGSVIEVYAPLVDDAGEVQGVFEIYQSFAPVLADIRRSNAIIWGVILIGSVLAYVMQVRMVQNASRRLMDTEAQVKKVNSRLQSSLAQIEEHSLGTLQALTTAVDAKDSYTASHSLSVTDYAVVIGRRLGVSREELDLLERAGLLHDVGKIGVPEALLLKPGRLTAEEFEIVKEHSPAGAHIIESIPFLQEIVPVVKHHHERWDGTGYPDGLAGQRIPKLARILAVADAFDAMTSDRPYRPAMRIAPARQEMIRYRGIQFDPAAVDALLEALDAEEIDLTPWDHRLSPEPVSA